MTLKDFWQVTDSPIMVLEATNGKVLSYSFDPNRYPALAYRPVIKIFAKDEKSVGLKREWEHNIIHAVVGV